VVDLAVTTLGGVVKPGDRLLDIVPDEEDLIVEARLDPRYIDRVHPGLPAELRLDAYLNRAMGPLVAGEVRLVSADAIRDERTGAVFYSLQVTIPAAQRARLGAARLQSGMLCSVMIKTGERTLLTYLTRPLVRRFSDSLTET
jgi:protease secretion system membrane fusion protein